MRWKCEAMAAANVNGTSPPFSNLAADHFAGREFEFRTNCWGIFANQP
jgi:hypothetical protein